MNNTDQSTSPTVDAVADASAKLSGKTALDLNLPIEVRRAAAASVLSKAGAAISARSQKPSRILPSLAKLDELAGLDTEIRTIWLALRALALPTGAQIGLGEESLENPITVALIDATGLVPTTDPDEIVRGILGARGGRDIETLAPGGREVNIEADGLTVGNGTGTLFVVDTSDVDAACVLIDSKSVSRASRDKIGPVSYNALENAALGEFSTTVFSSYRVRRIEIPGAQAHPTELVESAALASVVPPAPSYQPHFHPEVISKGILSDVQLETVIYAGEAHSKYLPAHPDDEKKIPPRQGFLVGHGTGVGKNRIGAGIIADNWMQGRQRHLWFSESARLIEDARRDWVALGGRAEDVIDIREISSGSRIPPFNGIIFSTYASLRGVNEHGSRMQQLVDWFGHGEEGVILFDEAQNLRNTRGGKKKRGSEVSQQGLAALDLQDRLPNARVTYVSATSASDIASIGYAIRLGLWGAGTAFRNSKRFFDEVESGGTNALEMVARDLKAMGLYLAANLSFEGVKYERLHRKLNPNERAAQDRLAELWLEIGDGMNRAMSLTGASRLPKTTKGRAHRMGSIHFAMSRARFFQALMASLNTPHMIESIREDLAKGYAAIIQMTNTFAANAERAISEAEDQGISLDDVEASAKDILIEYLRHGFPVVKMKAVRRNKKIWSEPVLDAQGNPVIEPRAVAIRDKLLQEVQNVSVPEGPLEQVLRAFGPDEVAEITGRSRRLVPAANGSQILEDRCEQDVSDDFRAFIDDEKRILMFSPAGGTGATYSAQKTYRNQRLRRHYVLQAGWRADLATQGMGRSHRSGQAQPPEYILMSTDLWANQRMVSAVAKGMRDLGAITRGLRQAASQEFFTQDDNLEDEFGETAWFNFVNKLHTGQIHGLSIGQFERQACITLRTNPHQLVKPLPPLRRFLNVMSAMSCDDQALFGQHYRQELQDLKLSAVEEGTFDRGIETIVPDSLIKLDDQVIFRDSRTGGETRMLKMLRIDELDPVQYADARRKSMIKGNTRIVKSAMTGRIAILCFPRVARGRMPHAEDKVEVIMPTGSRIRTREEVVQERWLQVDVTIAEGLWNAELKERGDEEEREFWVISGAMLPIWDKLPRDRSMVYRMETDEGEQIIGRLVSDDFVSSLLKRVDAVSTGGLPLDEVDESLHKRGIVTLANGWILEGRHNLATGRRSVLLSMPEEEKAAYATFIQGNKLQSIYGPLFSQAYFRLPADDASRRKALANILAESPAVGAAAL